MAALQGGPERTVTQARALQLLVARLDLGADGLKIRLRVDGLARMVREFSGIAAGHRKVAA